ncbi:MAG: preprotein translocase subunit YajC [Clostridia bacterium]|nr:preprotein translocase subunit YajC [Clostridia bacterium]
MLFNLLAEQNQWGTWLMLGILLVIIIVFMVFNRRTQMKRQQETMDMLNAIQPGNKVKTIGGICGVVVEVCPEDNTFILETGSEASGKSYVKFDKQAVYQTDAVVKKEEAAPVEEAPAEEPFEETAAPVEEAPVEEVAEESAKEE